MPFSFQSDRMRSTETEFLSAIAIGLHRPYVAVALPVGHGCAERFALPRARGHVLVAEALVERLPQDAVCLERLDRAFERARQLGELRPRVCVALDGCRRHEFSLDTVGGRRGDRGDREIWVGIGPGPAALKTAQLRMVCAHDCPYRARSVLHAPARADPREPARNQALV